MVSRYKFCPQCASRLAERQVNHRRLPACSQCSFIDWRNAKPCSGALVIQNGKVLLVKRGIEPYKGCWDIPGGFMEPHETPEQAATRELLEETGLAIASLEYLVALPDIYGPAPADGEEPDFTLNIYFVASVAGGTLKPSDDAVEAHWFAVDELPADDQIAFVHAKEVMKHLRKRLAAGI
jgi:ADP-ribose pyrophosphatase YjhB (NUDIX family)